MPGVYKIPMVRMAAMPDETPECKGLKVPHTEMYVWVHAQTVWSSRNGCYEPPWCVTGTCKLSGLEGTPKGIYAQIELSEQGKAENPMDNPAKNNKRMNLCWKVVVELSMLPAKKRATEEWPQVRQKISSTHSLIMQSSKNKKLSLESMKRGDVHDTKS